MLWRKTGYHGEKIHYSCRTSFENDYASLHINLVAETVCFNIWDYVFNMDETSVRINNENIKTMTPIIIDKTVINAKRNDKECFTTIGACTRNSIKKLIIQTKCTERSCEKSGANKILKFCQQTTIIDGLMKILCFNI